MDNGRKIGWEKGNPYPETGSKFPLRKNGMKVAGKFFNLLKNSPNCLTTFRLALLPAPSVPETRNRSLKALHHATAPKNQSGTTKNQNLILFFLFFPEQAAKEPVTLEGFYTFIKLLGAGGSIVKGPLQVVGEGGIGQEYVYGISFFI